MQLTKNFTLEEFLHSDNAERLGGEILKAQMNPPEHIIKNIKRQAEVIWQPVRNDINYMIELSSGYRCPELNAVTAGSSNASQHTLGEAADVKAKGIFNESSFRFVKEAIQAITGKVAVSKSGSFYLFANIALNMDRYDIDQLIHEFGTDGNPAWVHASTSERQNKRQILIKRNGEGYKTLSVKEALLLGC